MENRTASGSPSCAPPCHYCQQLVDQWPQSFEQELGPFAHHPDITSLEQCATITGCGICTQFVRSVSDTKLEVAREMMGSGRFKGCLTMYSGSSIDSIVQSENGIHDRWIVQLDFFDADAPYLIIKDDRKVQDHASEDESDVWPFVINMIPSVAGTLIQEVDFDPSPKKVLPIITQWMKTCFESHTLCKHSNEIAIPTRLVSTYDTRLRLCLSNDFKDCPKYATLSHCWGDNQFLTLKKDNIERFKEGIPDVALSKTFEDAIYIAKELAIPYVWIDSLCIVQDDAKDWEQEASLMGTVYGNSTLNIAAGWARDGRSGCFHPHPSSRARSQILIGNVLYDCVPSQLYSRSLSAMPLESRGWALQERILPSRSLYFTGTQIFWEYNHNIACENFPEGFPESLSYHNTYFEKVPISRKLWKFIVENFSSRKLTYPTDKLVAISGLARKIQSLTGDEYFAGLWRKDFESQLLWSRAVGVRTNHDPKQVLGYRAPSWSWACLDHLIDYRSFPENDERASFIEIVDVKVQLAGLDPFGQISDAKLRITCDYFLAGTMNRFVSMANGENYGRGYGTVSGTGLSVLTYIDSPEKHVGGQYSDVYFLPVTRLLSAGDLRLEGLILQAVNQVENNVYRRIGCFRLYEEHECARFLRLAYNYMQTSDEKTRTVTGTISGKEREIIEII